MDEKKDFDNKILLSSNLQRMGNPMKCMIDTMANMVAQIDADDNKDAIEELKKASKSIEKALEIVIFNVYTPKEWRK